LEQGKKNQVLVLWGLLVAQNYQNKRKQVQLSLCCDAMEVAQLKGLFLRVAI
jgi:hypothetical protein